MTLHMTVTILLKYHTPEIPLKSQHILTTSVSLLTILLSCAHPPRASCAAIRSSLQTACKCFTDSKI
jgi:hypothetical protein